ncbi:hypothetical protein MHYP_G00149840 [Metynnis hypsauchen]
MKLNGPQVADSVSLDQMEARLRQRAGMEDKGRGRTAELISNCLRAPPHTKVSHPGDPHCLNKVLEMRAPIAASPQHGFQNVHCPGYCKHCGVPSPWPQGCDSDAMAENLSQIGN